jgi:hypothetical protein
MTKVAFRIGRRDTGANGPTYGGNGGDSGLVGWRHPHRLAALFVCSDAAELREKAQWAGSGAEGRVALLRELQVRRTESSWVCQQLCVERVTEGGQRTHTPLRTRRGDT